MGHHQLTYTLQTPTFYYLTDGVHAVGLIGGRGGEETPAAAEFAEEREEMADEPAPVVGGGGGLETPAAAEFADRDTDPFMPEIVGMFDPEGEFQLRKFSMLPVQPELLVLRILDPDWS